MIQSCSTGHGHRRAIDGLRCRDLGGDGLPYDVVRRLLEVRDRNGRAQEHPAGPVRLEVEGTRRDGAEVLAVDSLMPVRLTKCMSG